MATIIYLGTVDDDLTNGANYLGGAAAADGDTLIFRNTKPIRRNLDLSATELALAIFEEGAVGGCGLESEYLRLDADVLVFNGRGEGVTWRISTSTDASAIQVLGTAAEGESGLAPLQLWVNSASTVVQVDDGIVGIGNRDRDAAATAGTVRVGASGQSPTVTLGRLLTPLRIDTHAGATHVLGVDGTDINVFGGELDVDADGDLNDVTVYGGTIYGDRFGTLGHLYGYGGTLDTTRTQTTRTITDTTIYAPPDPAVAGFKLKRGLNLAFTNGVVADGRLALTLRKV